MGNVLGAMMRHALRWCGLLAGLAALAIASPALANDIYSARVTPDCDGFTIEVTGTVVASQPTSLEYAFELVPAVGEAVPISGSIPLALHTTFYVFSATQSRAWSEFGVSTSGGYQLSSGKVALMMGTITLHPAVPISFSPATLDCPCTGAIGDLVWLDADANGIQDPGEAGIAGALLSLTGEGISRTALTDANGNYLFTGLCPGAYQVAVTPPAGDAASPVLQGPDRGSDSNPNPSTVTLTSEVPIDLSVDFGFYPPPCTGAIGDFVWTDANANGIQDPGENGIAGVVLELRDGDSGALIQSTTTDAGGSYQFTDLCPGSYQVVVNTPAGYTATTAEVGPDRGLDSNPSPWPVVLTAANPVDLTVDFGFVPNPPACTGIIGDYVWEDLDGDGIQDTGEPGIADVAVSLHDAVSGALLMSATTGADGLYRFTEVCPGSYLVIVDTPPAGYSPSPCLAGDARFDNNCSPAQVTLPEYDSVDLTIDFGYVPPPACTLALGKTCEIVQPPGPAWTSCKGKIQRFTMIWPESLGTINISGIANDAPGGVVNPGQRVTFTGPFTVNDLYLNVSGAVSGRSTFHVSCSDADMDGLTSTNLEQQQLPGRAQDCGKFEGNGKALSGAWVNSWLLDGLVDAEGKVLECSPTSVPSASCGFQQQPPPSCGTGGTYKPTTLTFQYTGGGCSTQDNEQAVGKTSCTGHVDPALPVNVVFPGGTASNVPPGGTFTMPRTQAQSLITLTNAGGTETDSIHTSCSQPLSVGDVYFSLTLVAEDGVGAGQQVKYSYDVTNTGSVAVTGVAVVDDKLGTVPGSPIASLAAGQTATLTATALIEQTTTNVATASGAACPGGVTASATVTVLPPPACTVAARFASLADDKIVYALTNTSADMVTLDALTLTFPAARQRIKEVRLDGTIYKSDSSALVVTPGVTIGPADWTNADVTKRQLNPGETRNLEILFQVKAKATAADFSGTAAFREGCQVGL